MSPVRRYLDGVGLLGRGLRLYVRSPRLLLLGLVPAVVSAILFLGALVALLYFLPDLADAATWFAADWSQTARMVTRLAAGIGILGVALLLGVLTFTAFTLLIGDPFYERISEAVEQAEGGVVDEVEVGFWRGWGRSLRDSLRLLLITVPLGGFLFLGGLVPVVGQTVVPVIGATIGGWFLAVELVGVPFSRRGLRLADRRRLLRAHRAEALGFGTAAFVCFLVPGGAVLMMPAAVAGGTILARRVLPASPVVAHPRRS